MPVTATKCGEGSTPECIRGVYPENKHNTISNGLEYVTLWIKVLPQKLLEPLCSQKLLGSIGAYLPKINYCMHGSSNHGNDYTRFDFPSQTNNLDLDNLGSNEICIILRTTTSTIKKSSNV